VDLAVGALPFTQLGEGEPQRVGVEAAAESLVGGDDNQADALRGAIVGRLGQERVFVLGIREREMRSDVANLVAVRTRRAHPLLRLAHLRRGDHFHRLGDLARVLHALDLGSNLFATGHLFSLTSFRQKRELAALRQEDAGSPLARGRQLKRIRSS